MFWWVLAAAGLALALAAVARDFGDSPEYLAYAKAWWSHGSPLLDQQDYAWARQWHPQRGLPVPAAAGLGAPLSESASISPDGFIRLHDGRLVTFHFWLYPLWAAPLLGLTEALGAAPFVAFALANGLIVSIALLHLWSRWRLPGVLKHTAAALLLLGGVLYNLPWPHPEVWTACLVFVALGEWCFGRRWVACLLVGLAATHNPPLVVLLLWFALQTSWDVGAQARQTSFAQALRRQGAVVLGGLASLALVAAPAAFFGLWAGVANPILASGAASWSLPSLARTMATLFDPNLGLAIGAPGVLVLSVCAAALSVRAAPRGHRMAAMAPTLAAWLGVLAMAWLCAATTNFNHGHLVFNRYAVWLGVVLLVAGLVSARSLGGSAQRALCTAALLVQLTALAAVLTGGKPGRDYLSFRPWASWLIESDVLGYRPVPEVFAERVLGSETDLSSASMQRFVFALGPADAPWLLMVPAASAAQVAARLSNGCGLLASDPPREGWVYLRPDPSRPCSTHVLEPSSTVVRRAR
jgi:hypothetical protein